MFSGSGYAQSTATLVAKFAGPVTVVVPLASEDQLLVVAQNTVVILDANGRVLKQNELGMHQVTHAKLSLDRKSIWIAGGDPAETGRLIEIDLQDLSQRQMLKAANDVFTSLDLSADGKLLVSSSIDGQIYRFQLEDPLELSQGKSQPTMLKGHSKAVSKLVLMGDSELVSVAEDMSVRLWDLENETLKRTMNQHVGAVLGVRLLNGAESSRPVIASWGKDRTVRFWQPTIGRMMRFATLEAVPLSSCWNEQQQTLFVGDSEGSVHSIDWQTGKLVGKRQITNDWIVTLCEDEQERVLYAGTTSGELWRWEIEAAESED